MIKYFVLGFNYYLSWIPFFLLREKVVVLEVGEFALKSQVKDLTLLYLAFTTLPFVFGFLIFQKWIIKEKNKEIKKLEKQISEKEFENQKYIKLLTHF